MYLGFINDSEFGNVFFYCRKGMRSVRMKLGRMGQIEITVPEGRYPKSGLISLVHEHRDRIRTMQAKRSDMQPQFHEGQVIPCLRHHLEIIRKPSDSIYYDFGFDRTRQCFLIKVPHNCDFSKGTVTSTIKKCMKQLGKVHAPELIIPIAEQLALEKDCTVKSFEIGNGLKKLGHCTADKVISLSCMLIYYPEELVKYVICHEFAHLKEMNHSPLFHAECNRLCNGREKELERKLRAYNTSYIQ